MDTSVSVFFCERSFLCRKFTLCVYNLVVSAQVMVTNQTVTEGDTISVDLSVQGAKKPFPQLQHQFGCLMDKISSIPAVLYWMILILHSIMFRGTCQEIILWLSLTL